MTYGRMVEGIQCDDKIILKFLKKNSDVLRLVFNFLQTVMKMFL